MTAKQPQTEADIDALALALHRAQFTDGATAMTVWWASADEHRERFRALARAAYGHLDRRLIPDGSETEVDFGVRNLDIEKGQWRVTTCKDQRAAEWWAGDLPWGAHATVQHRRRITTPWQSVDQGGGET